MRDLSGVAVYDSEIPSTDSERDDVGPREVRSTDVSKLSFPLQIVIAIVVSAISASATMWAVQARTTAAQSSMQSDIRDILTRMEGASKLDEAGRRLQDMQTTQMNESINDLKRQTQLLQLQYADLSKQITQRR